MHPCHHGGAKCCGGTVHAPFALRLTAFFHADQAGLQISYDAFPVCGDGFDFLVRPCSLKHTQDWVGTYYQPVCQTMFGMGNEIQVQPQAGQTDPKRAGL